MPQNKIVFNEILDKESWDKELELYTFDVYHTYDFHIAHASVDKGTPVLFSCKLGDKSLLIPLLTRDIDKTGFKDATSVYGYPGILAHNLSEIEITNFFNYFIEHLNQKKYVSLFSRMNTFTTPNCFLNSQCESIGNIVSIDLSLGDKEQVKLYRKNHLRDIKKLKAKGFECKVLDSDTDNLKKFQEIYNATMSALDAKDYYFFNNDYYLSLFENSKSEIKLVAVEFDGEIAAMGIFTFTNGIVQYHLGGTHPDFYKFAPTKLLFDFVRAYSTQKGCRLFNLGGGLGSIEDNLFNFKKGFSDRVEPFFILKEIINNTVYEDLCKGKKMNSYFPSYRA